MCVWVQDGESCLSISSKQDHEAAKNYLCNLGGEQLKKLTEAVSWFSLMFGYASVRKGEWFKSALLCSLLYVCTFAKKSKHKKDFMSLVKL